MTTHKRRHTLIPELGTLTGKLVNIGNLAEIDSFKTELSSGSFSPNVYVVSSDVWNSIFNGTPNARDIREHRDPDIQGILSEGWVAIEFMGGILCMDRRLNNSMYFLCADGRTQGGMLTWVEWEGPEPIH